MADNTKIEWTDATWNPVNGCSLASPGCTNCYAMKQAHRVPQRRGLTQHTNGGMVWTGEVRFDEAKLTQPLHWKRPRRIFVCAHGDLFHDAVPDEWIDRVFAVMALCSQHTFQVLTKRSARMQEYFRPINEWGKRVAPLLNELKPSSLWNGSVYQGRQEIHGKGFLPNVWLGVSVEDQCRADERIPDLLATPAAVRWLSCEPLLGPVDVRPWIPTCYECGASCGLRLPTIPAVERCTECGEECGPETEPVFSEGCPKCCGELEPVCPDCGHYMVYRHPDTPNIDWVVAGGESGPGARPMHPDWPRALRDQCAAAGVPFFFKQWGDWMPTQYCEGAGENFGNRFLDGSDRWATNFNGPWQSSGPGRQGYVDCYYKAGKRTAGRLLDGIEHNGFPAAVGERLP